MSDDTNLLKKRASETASTLRDQVTQLEKTLQEQVSSAKQVVEEGVEQVKRFSPAEQVKAHPFPAVGIAVFAGFLTTYAFRKGILRGISQTFATEIALAKSIGTAMALEKISKAVERSSPFVSGTISGLKAKLVEKNF